METPLSWNGGSSHGNLKFKNLGSLQVGSYVPESNIYSLLGIDIQDPKGILKYKCSKIQRYSKLSLLHQTKDEIRHKCLSHREKK